jgi:NADPH-dependent 2,4-dienoyl-CoA reductase/sulfur reductase-like enzyme
LLGGDRWDAIDAHWQLGRRAVGLDTAERTVALDDGQAVRYGELVIATGVTPRHLEPEPRAGVHVLRTLADLVALRAALTPGTRLVVVGAGFLGLEVAATARDLGVEVTVVEPLDAPLEARLGPLAAGRLLALHADRAVDVRAGVGVAQMIGSPVRAVELTDGSAVDADVVLVAIGCRPDLDWLTGSGLTIDDGLVCDDRCRAGRNVWGAGDVARWHHPRLGCHLRVEHRANASEQGRHVGANIMGADERFAPIPSFWTDHYDVKIQVMGIVPDGVPGVLAEGDPAGESFVVTFAHPETGAPIGVLGWNAMRQLMPYRKQIAQHW